ncbi:MAG: hypothetical protein QOI63_607 [Thermoplasmata archaeon]|nr:hypothetical protein [Thermoplasmata archaeon]
MQAIVGGALLCAALLAPLGGAQPSPPTAAELSVDAVTPPGVVVLHGKNTVAGQFTNSGNTPLTVNAFLQVTDGARTTGQFLLPGSPFTMRPGDTQPVSLEWDGTTTNGAAGAMDLAGGAVATLTVHDQASDEANGGFSPSPAVQAQRASARVPVEDHTLQLTASTPPADARMQPNAQWGSYFTITVRNVRNPGSVDRPARLVLSKPGTCPDGWTFSFDRMRAAPQIDTPTIKAGESTQAYVFVTAPPSAAPGDTGCAHVDAGTVATYAQDPHPASTSADLVSPKVEQGAELALFVSAQPSGSTNPGQTATFTVSVRNDGNFNDHVYLLAMPPAGDDQPVALDATPQAPRTVPPGAANTQPFSVAITVPTDLTRTGALAGVHSWRIQAHSQGPPGGPVGGKTFDLADSLDVVVPARHGASLQTVGTTPTTVQPGATIQVKLRLCNAGNTPDQLRLTSDLPAGWGSLAPVTAAAGPGPCAATGSDQAFDVKVPPSAPANVYGLTFRAASLQPDAAPPAEVHLDWTVAAAAVPDLKVDEGKDTKPVSVGHPATFQLTAANVGNNAGTFTVSATKVEAGPHSGWSLSGLDTGFTLAKQATHALTLTVTPPTPSSGGLDPRDHVDVTVKLTVDAKESTVVLHAGQPFPDLAFTAASILPSETGLYRAHPANVTFTVANQGFVPASQAVDLDVVFKDKATAAEVGTAAVRVPALGILPEDRTFTVIVPLPVETYPDIETLDGTLVMTATLDKPGELAESQEANNVAAKELRVQVFDVAVTGPNAVTVVPGETVAFDGTDGIKVQNLGSLGYDITVTSTMDKGWASFKTYTYNNAGNGLGPSGEKIIDDTFTVPLVPGSESSNLTVRAALSDLPAVYVEHKVRIVVSDTAAPTFTPLAVAPAVARAGEEVTFHVGILDATGIQQARLYLVDPQGSVRYVPLLPSATDATAFTANATFDQPGAYQAYAWARDRSAVGNAADTSTTPLQLQVQEGSSLALQLVTPAAGAPVRPGTPLVYALTGKHPVKAAHYESEGRRVALAATPPLQVATDGLPDGLFNLTLTVEDVSGQTLVRHDSFHIDGTPPVVTRITMSPAAPAVGDTVLVRTEVQDASPMQSVALRLQGAAGVVQDVPMNGTDGSFYATFAYPSGTQIVQVVAQDAAGNRGFAQRSTLGALGGGNLFSPIPAAPWAAALLLAAAAWRRRT